MVFLISIKCLMVKDVSFYLRYKCSFKNECEYFFNHKR